MTDAKRSLANLVLGSALLLATPAYAQSVSVGIKGGVPLTNGLSDFSITSAGALTRTFSESKEYLIGPSLELHLPVGFSVEVDALYRPVNFTSIITVPNLTPAPTSDNVSSWQFPVLAKYRFPFPIIKPLLEAGPSFRTTGSQLNWFSNRGLTLGGGIEVKIGRLRFGPELRFTRWGSDAAASLGVLFNPPSQKNQAEFLLGISF
ncbi:MAG: hypothetical protein ABL995_17060 [Bryobacteraceae bacterium]